MNALLVVAVCMSLAEPHVEKAVLRTPSGRKQVIEWLNRTQAAANLTQADFQKLIAADQALSNRQREVVSETLNLKYITNDEGRKKRAEELLAELKQLQELNDQRLRRWEEFRKISRERAEKARKP